MPLSKQQADLVRAIVAAREDGRPVAWDKLVGDHAPGSREALDLRRALLELTEDGIVTFSGPDRAPQAVALTKTIGERAATELGPAAPAPNERDQTAERDAAQRVAEYEAEEAARQRAYETNEAASRRYDEVAIGNQAMIDRLERQQREWMLEEDDEQ